MAQIDVPEGMRTDAATNWPPQELIDDFLGNFPHDFDFRPGETLEVDDEAAQQQARLFRDVLGQYGSGVTIVTTVQDGSPIGLTCQSFTSVSLDPPLVAFLPTKASRAFAAIKETGHFCVNFLAADQVDVSNVMASRSEDKFAEVAWTRSVSGSALLDGAVAHTDCTVEAIHDAGDHWIVVGRVVDLAVDNTVDPLLFFRGKYHTATMLPPAVKAEEPVAVPQEVVKPVATEHPAATGWRPGKPGAATSSTPTAAPATVRPTVTENSSAGSTNGTWRPWAPGRR